MLPQILTFAGLTALAAAATYGCVFSTPARRLSPRAAKLLGWVCRLALAAVFILAAVQKLRDPYSFAASIYAYRVAPPVLATIGGVIMPVIEIVASLALVTGLLWRGGASVLGGLLLIFIAALFQAILRGIDIDCGCFGKGSSPVSFWLIARNYGLLILALFLLVRDATARGDTHRSNPRRV